MHTFHAAPASSPSLLPLVCAAFAALSFAAPAAAESHQHGVTMIVAPDPGDQDLLMMKSLVSVYPSEHGHTLVFDDESEFDLGGAGSMSVEELHALYAQLALDIEFPETRQQVFEAIEGANSGYISALEESVGLVDVESLQIRQILDIFRRAGQVETYEIPLVFDMDVFIDAQHFIDTSRQWTYDAMVQGSWCSWESLAKWLGGAPADPLPPYTESVVRYESDGSEHGVTPVTIRVYDVNGSENSGDVMRKVGNGPWHKVGDHDKGNDGVRDLTGKSNGHLSSGKKKQQVSGKKPSGLIWMPYYLTTTSFFNTPSYEPSLASTDALFELVEIGVLDQVEDYVGMQHRSGQPVDVFVIEQLLQDNFISTVTQYDGVEIATLNVSVDFSQ